MNEATDFQASKVADTTGSAPPVVCSAFVRPLIVVAACYWWNHGWVMVPGCRWWMVNHLELAAMLLACSALMIRRLVCWVWEWGKPWNPREQPLGRLWLVTLSLLMLWMIRDCVETTMHRHQCQDQELPKPLHGSDALMQSVQHVSQKAPSNDP